MISNHGSEALNYCVLDSPYHPTCRIRYGFLFTIIYCKYSDIQTIYVTNNQLFPKLNNDPWPCSCFKTNVGLSFLRHLGGQLNIVFIYPVLFVFSIKRRQRAHYQNVSDQKTKVLKYQPGDYVQARKLLSCMHDLFPSEITDS